MREYCQQELTELREAGRLRRSRIIEWSEGCRALVDGQPAVVMCSNDYLGLASSRDLAETAAEAAHRFGVGSGSSRLISGSSPVHVAAERKLATFLGTEAALLFPSGYQANVGALSALAKQGDHIFSDALNHASLIDGCRLSRATVQVYPHCDLAALERAIATRPARSRAWIVTETLFSMDGDEPDPRVLVDIARRHDAFLVVDEAHALGVFGPEGRGLCAEAGVVPDLLIGTLGKAFGCAGAFAAGSEQAIELLYNRARTFVFTTAIGPPLAAAVDRAIDLVRAAEAQREHLHALTRRARNALSNSGIPPGGGRGPILPVLLGDDTRTMQVSEALLQRGYLVSGIRPPTVPIGTSRLRMTLSAAHSVDQIDGVCAALADLI